MGSVSRTLSAPIDCRFVGGPLDDNRSSWGPLGTVRRSSVRRLVLIEDVDELPERLTAWQHRDARSIVEIGQVSHRELGVPFDWNGRRQPDLWEPHVYERIELGDGWATFAVVASPSTKETMPDA